MKQEEIIKTFNFNTSAVEIELKDLSFIKELPKLLGMPHSASVLMVTRTGDFCQLSIGSRLPDFSSFSLVMPS